MNTAAKVPNKFKWLIKSLKDAGFDSPLIAGGAVRDLYFNRSSKDIDVFVRLPNNECDPSMGQTAANVVVSQAQLNINRLMSTTTVTSSNNKSKPKKSDRSSPDLSTQLKEALSAQSVKLASANDPDGEYYDTTGVIDAVYTVNFDDGSVVDVIVLTIDPIEYVDVYFDVGICKAHFNGSRLHYSTDFLKDARNKTLTLVGLMDAAQLHRSLSKHCGRLLTYFPGFEVHIDRKRVLGL